MGTILRGVVCIVVAVIGACSEPSGPESCSVEPALEPLSEDLLGHSCGLSSACHAVAGRSLLKLSSRQPQLVCAADGQAPATLDPAGPPLLRCGSCSESLIHALFQPGADAAPTEPGSPADQRQRHHQELIAEAYGGWCEAKMDALCEWIDEGCEGCPSHCEQDGAEERRPCGSQCGTERRTCDGRAWSEWSACEDEGPCEPGTVETRPCACGDERRTCSETCGWSDWSSCRPVDLTQDLRHCGACDHPCAEAEVCEDGACRCGPGFFDCYGSCGPIPFETPPGDNWGENCEGHQRHSTLAEPLPLMFDGELSGPYRVVVFEGTCGLAIAVTRIGERSWTLSSSRGVVERIDRDDDDVTGHWFLVTGLADGDETLLRLTEPVSKPGEEAGARRIEVVLAPRGQATLRTWYPICASDEDCCAGVETCTTDSGECVR